MHTTLVYKGSKVNFVREEYIIRYDLQDKDGYWKNNLEMSVRTDTPMSMMKNNHEAAEQIANKEIRNKNPGCKFNIHRSMYV